MIYLDTHVIVWLYLGDMSAFSFPAKTAMNMNDLSISPMVAFELTYFHEIGRLKPTADTILTYLAERIGLKVCNAPFEQVVTSAMKHSWTRDPFDRIIVGHATLKQCGLVTKDQFIHEHYEHAIW